jgi:hypothetical protein
MFRTCIFLIAAQLAFGILLVKADDEVIFNSSGEAIRLKADGTWELIEHDTPGKIVIRIVGVEEHSYGIREENDFGEEVIEYAFGCSYTFDIENQLEFPARIMGFEMRIGSFKGSIVLNKGLKPGDRFQEADAVYGHDHLWRHPEDTVTKDPFTEVELNALKAKYGCEAQIGTGDARATLHILRGYPLVEFPEELGISRNNANSFVTTSEIGVIPLYNTF